MTFRTATITFANGTKHTCIFGMGDWLTKFDPPWEAGPGGLFHPIPGVDHKPYLYNWRTGERKNIEESGKPT